MTTNFLMEKYSNKYNILNIKEILESPSTEEEKLIALEARFTELKNRVARNKRSENKDDNDKSSKKQKKGKIKERKDKTSWMFQ